MIKSSSLIKWWVLAVMATVTSTVFAQSQLAQTISFKENPKFLPVFLERFSDGFRAQTRFAQPEMPETLRGFWRENISQPRDFSEELFAGLRWPRFQWGIESRTDKNHLVTVRPIYQWFDIREPERLVREWNKAFCMDREKGWIGVSWTGDRRDYEFYYKEPHGLRIRQYENEVFAREILLQNKDGEGLVGIELKPATAQAVARASEDKVFTIQNVGRVAPQLKDPRAAHLQFNLQREFLIFPRTFARATNGSWERVYFP